MYWHLLSLDAPTVAALWCWSFARVAHIELPRFAPLLLAVGTWLVYVADRILDGMDRANLERLRERHYFYLQHRTAFLMVGAIVSPVFAWVVFTRMSPAVRLEDAAVFAVAALFPSGARAQTGETASSEELAVGVLLLRRRRCRRGRISRRRRAGSSGRGFALLCWINCVV